MIKTLMTILIIGDSLSVQPGQFVQDMLPNHNVIVQSKVSSGLNNSLFYDWYTQSEILSRKHNPDVVFIILGTNDGNCYRYPEKVEKILKNFEGKIVYWIGIPPMRDLHIKKREDHNNKMLKTLLGDKFIDLKDIFGDVFTYEMNGNKIRTDDGIHYTNCGGKMVADKIVEVIKSVNSRN